MRATPSKATTAVANSGGRKRSNRLVSLGNGVAPLCFAGDLQDTTHLPDCRYRSSIAASISETHSTRALCSCMTNFQLDKQFALEIQSRDMTIDAYALVLTMIRVYGIQPVAEDDDLFTIIARYDFISKLYELIGPSLLWAKAPYLPLLSQAEFDVEHHGNKLFAKLMSYRRHANSIPMQMNYLDSYGNAPWKTMVEEKGVCRVLMRCHPTDARKASFRLDGFLDTNLSGILSLVSEVEMANKWAPYFRFPIKVGLKRSFCFDRNGRMDKSSSYEIELPWPMTSRDAAIHGYMVDDLERNGRLVFCIQSLDQDYPIDPCLLPPAIPDSPPGFCRITMEGACLLSSVGPNKVLMENLWNVDLKENVPSTLLNFVGGTFIKVGFHSFNKFCKQVANGEEWKKARLKDPWLYEYVEKRIKELEGCGIDICKQAQRQNGFRMNESVNEDFSAFMSQLSSPSSPPIVIQESTSCTQHVPAMESATYYGTPSTVATSSVKNVRQQPPTEHISSKDSSATTTTTTTTGWRRKRFPFMSKNTNT